MEQQLPLTCSSPNKRPKISVAMRREVAQKLITQMMQAGLLDGCDEQGCVDDLVEVTRYDLDDGYKIARELEKRHLWDCDMQIAEELEEFAGLLSNVHAVAEKRWAAENPTEPTFAKGDHVVWRGSPATVDGIYEYRPQCYTIKQGNMRIGECYVVPFEDVTAPP